VGWCGRWPAERNGIKQRGVEGEGKEGSVGGSRSETRKQNGGASAFQLQVGDGRSVASGARRDACVADSSYARIVRGAAAVAEPPKRRLPGAQQGSERIVRQAVVVGVRGSGMPRCLARPLPTSGAATWHGPPCPRPNFSFSIYFFKHLQQCSYMNPIYFFSTGV
jgi:hypothetical protein